MIRGIIALCPGDTQQRKPHKEIPASVRFSTMVSACSASLLFGDVKTDFSVGVSTLGTAASDPSTQGDNVKLPNQHQ